MNDHEMDASPEATGVDRRRFLRNVGIGAAATGAAWAAPSAIETFSGDAWAAGTSLLDVRAYTGTVVEVSVRGGRGVKYQVSGAGGGGGANNTNNIPNTNVGGAGGAGSVLTGTIPAQGSDYMLYVAVGQGGNGGVAGSAPQVNDKGLSLYGSGGMGAGRGTTAPDTNFPGRGGGGGGASAISDATTLNGTILVVAPGGGGGGGRGPHWSGSTSTNGAAGSTSSGFTSTLAGARGSWTQNDQNWRSGQGGYGGTGSAVGNGGLSGGGAYNEAQNVEAGWPGFAGGDRRRNESGVSNPGTNSGYTIVRSSDGGGGGMGGDTSTNGWDGAGGGGGGGGYRGAGGGGGGKGNPNNGAGDGGGGGSGSAFTAGAGTTKAAAGAAGGAGGTGSPGTNGQNGTDGWVILTYA